MVLLPNTIYPLHSHSFFCYLVYLADRDGDVGGQWSDGDRRLLTSLTRLTTPAIVAAHLNLEVQRRKGANRPMKAAREGLLALLAPLEEAQ